MLVLVVLILLRRCFICCSSAQITPQSKHWLPAEETYFKTIGTDQLMLHYAVVSEVALAEQIVFNLDRSR